MKKQVNWLLVGVLLASILVVCGAGPLPKEAVGVTGVVEEEVTAPSEPSNGGMRLEVGNIHIKKVQLGEKTEIKQGVLYVNAAELKAHLEEDKRLGRVDVDIANPGDSTRIVRIQQVYEPRARTGDRKGQFPFPGAMGPGMDAGEGSICVLKGSAVIVSNAANMQALEGPWYVATNPDSAGTFIQMSGMKGDAEPSELAKTANVVVTTYPVRDIKDPSYDPVERQATPVEHDDYAAAMALAGLRAAAYLGRAGEDLKPDDVEVYELPPVSEVCKGMEDLPKIAYVFSIANCNNPQPKAYGTNVTAPILYGADFAGPLAYVAHPNEVFDGAVVCTHPNWFTSVYSFQNNPFIKELYSRHGKDICFVGMVMTQHTCDVTDNKRGIAMTARQVVDVLGADGVIVSKSGGGAPRNQLTDICKLCQAEGVQAVAMPDTVNCIYTNPEPKIGLVDTGVGESAEFEAVEKVIGFHYSLKAPPRGAMKGSIFRIMDKLGGGPRKAVYDWLPDDDPVKGQAPGHNVVMDKLAVTRAVDMVLDKIAGRPWEPEIVAYEGYPPLETAPGIRDITKAKIAIVSGSGLVRRDDEVRFPPMRNETGEFAIYDITGIDKLDRKVWSIWHGGYREDYALADLHRLVPLPTLRKLEKEGKIGELSNTMYCYSSLVNRYIGMRKIGEAVAPLLKADEVDGVIMVST